MFLDPNALSLSKVTFLLLGVSKFIAKDAIAIAGGGTHPSRAAA